jgi:hypothetical protein
MLLAAAVPIFSAAIVSSTFDNPADGVDGWTIVGDGSAPAHVPAGGNPGGYITTTDQAAGSIVYWVAPAKFLGDRTAAFGGTITFDLRQSIAGSQFVDNNPLVRLTGNGTVLSFFGSGPATAFTSYTVPLTAAAGWTSGGAPATEAQIQNALANLTDFRIRAEFAFLAGDVDDLDYVAINAIPEPSTLGFMVLGGLGLAGLRAATCTFRRSRPARGR